jgi:hypothetical protein
MMGLKHYTRMERLARGKRTSLLSLFVSYKEQGVLNTGALYSIHITKILRCKYNFTNRETRRLKKNA